MSAEMLHIQHLSEEEWQSSAFGEEWNRLLASAIQSHIFSCWDWSVAWWNQYQQSLRSHVLALYKNGGKLIGIAPLYISRERVIHLLPIRTIRFIGDHSVGSEYLGVISAPSYEAEVSRCVLDHLLDCQPSIHRFYFKGLCEDSPAAADLITDLKARKGWLDLQSEACSSISLPSTYEEYLQKLSKKFRWNVQYQTRRIRQNCSLTLVQTEREEEIDFHLDQLFALHNQRWEKRQLPGSFQTEKKRSFYRDISRRLLKCGWLRFFHLKLNGTIRACIFGFRYRDTFYELQTGYDIEWDSQFTGLGVVLKGLVIESCIKEGVKTYDFLGGTEDFKTRWLTSQQMTTELAFFLPHPWASLCHGTSTWATRVKHSLKKKILGETWDFDVTRWRLKRFFQQSLGLRGKQNLPIGTAGPSPSDPARHE